MSPLRCPPPLTGPTAPTTTSTCISTPLPASQATLDLTQTDGGSVLAQYNGSTTMTGFTNLVAGSNVLINAVPRKDYKVVSINGDTTGCDGTAGKAVSTALSLAAGSNSATAVFAIVPTIKVALAYPKFAVVGTPVTVSLNGTTSNDTGLTYDFNRTGSYTTWSGPKTDNEDPAANSNASYTFTPKGATDYTVSVTVKTDNGGSVTKNVVISVEDTAEAENKLCLNCHTGSTPQVVSDLAAGNHSERACVDCHTDAPHAAPFDGQNCVNCHHNKGPEAQVMTSNHNTLKHNTEALCQRCHTLEGYRAFNKYVGDETVLAPLETAQAINPDMTSAPTCAACHSEHVFKDADGNIVLRSIDGWDPNGNGTADQFDLCTSCHVYYNQDGKLTASGTDASGTAEFHHGDTWYRTIASTHYDNPATTDVIEGYVIRTKSGKMCFDCHGHNLTANTQPGKTPTVYTEWAQSAHAGGLLKAKYEKNTELNVPNTEGILDYKGDIANVNRTPEGTDEIMKVGATAETGAAFVEEGYAGASDACKRCHTATGASAYLSDPVGYDPTTLDYSHLADGQREMLYCWACHTDVEKGELRPVGAVTADYTFNGNPATFADVGASNVCIACHAGRESAGSIMALTAAGNDFTNVGFKNSHYTAAAGLMYVKDGYDNFTDPSTAIGSTTYGATMTANEDGGELDSVHRDFGTTTIDGEHGITADDGIDSNGPCVTCHMSGGHHTLEIDADAYNNVCSKCHTSEGGEP